MLPRSWRLSLVLFLLLWPVLAAHARAGGGQTYSRPATSSYHPPSRPAYTPPRSTPSRPSTPSYRPSSPSRASTPSGPRYGTAPVSTAGSTPTAEAPRKTGFFGGILELVIWLIMIAAMVVSLILGVLALIGLFAKRLNRRQAQADEEWLAAREALAALRREDAAFSEHVFTDFVTLLYTRLQEARGAGSMEALRAFVAAEICEECGKDAAGRCLQAVDEVIVGGVTIEKLGGLEPTSEVLLLVLSINANFTETASDQRKRWFVCDRLTFTRRRGTRSKSPEDMRSLACPACGAPSELRPDGTCPYCDRPVANGEFQWLLTACERLDQTDLPQTNVTDVAPEVGTDDPDLRPPDFDETRNAFHERHPDFDEKSFEQKARGCFMQVQAAWSSGRWNESRALVSDAMFDRNRYWIDLYAAQGLQNRLDDVVVERLSPVRYDQDAFFDCITVRIHARMRDYYVDGAGTVKGGDAKRPRRFSEYWTFLRRTDFDADKVAHGSGCPNCGAPLSLNATGECAHCASKINSGHFDWVLTRIEQDEEYTPA